MDRRARTAARTAAALLGAAALALAPATAGTVVIPGQAVDDTLSVAQDGNAGLDVTANDFTPLGYLLETLANPGHGRLEGRMGSPGWYQYYPAAGYSGSDSFRYRLTFDDGTVSIGTVRITVVANRSTTTTTTRRTTTTTTGRRTTTSTTGDEPTTTTTRARRTTTTTRNRTTTTSTSMTTTSGPAGPPVAVDDSAAADFGAPVRIPVLANDRAPGGGLVPGSVVVVTAPRHGTAQPGPDGSVLYLATEDTTAYRDSFRYRVSDRAGASAEAEVTVRLQEPDDLLGGRTSSVPGGRLDVNGGGCQGDEPVRILLDGAPAAAGQALADGRFSIDVTAPDRLGRYRLRAVCAGHALQSWLDVVQTTSGDGRGRAAVAAGVLGAVGGILTFYLLTGFLLAPPAARVARPRPEPDEPDEIELRGWEHR